MWLYAIAIIGIVVVPTFLGGNPGKQISFQKFANNMLKQRDVDRVSGL
jgi:AFG3 family protein